MTDDRKEHPLEAVTSKRTEPFDLSSEANRDLLVKKSGLDYQKLQRTLELHIYTPL